MDETRAERREWIGSSRPSITEILNQYPRFQDVDTAVSVWTCDIHVTFHYRVREYVCSMQGYSER